MAFGQYDMTMQKLKFTVDTHLFRELGELLVGRDSTALVELIKNAYDADATSVTVTGYQLHHPEEGRIIIVDDGIGMTPEQFKEGFLRIASRLKEDGSRRSLLYKRRYTGAKGIGRLAAHKLAKHLRIISVPSSETSPDSSITDASIDWDVVEAQETLDDLSATDAIQIEPAQRVGANSKQGTTIELTRLRRKWTPAERARFFSEIQTFSPPTVLIEPPALAGDDRPLFQRPRVKDAETTDPGWAVNLEGEFEGGEDYWQALSQAAQWVIEVDASQGSKEVKYSISPTEPGCEEFPAATQAQHSMSHPDPECGPFFQARVLIREGRLGTDLLRSWQGRSSGIRVYLEGFRVLPYGEPEDDWLSIDADYTQRAKTLSFLSEFEPLRPEEDKKEGLLRLRKNQYFGAVFLTTAGCPSLRMLVNREGFVPEAGFRNLVTILRTAVNLSVRVRAAAKVPSRTERSQTRRIQAAEEVNASSRLDLRHAVEQSVHRASELATEARVLAAKGDFRGAELRIEQAAKEFSLGSESSERLITERSMLHILASVGTQMSAFVHEINAILGSTIALEGAITKIRETEDLSTSAKRKLASVQAAVGDLRRSVERQASYLTDVTSPDARRRRSRQKLRDRFEAGKRLVAHIADRRGIDTVDDIPPDLKSPPMFPAELTVVFSNLLTNAIKAASPGGKIRAYAEKREDGSTVLRLENTGAKVSPADGEKWFRPFESTTVSVDPVLGQGMGMGLPITRNLLEEYGATISFVKPSGRPFSTCLEIVFPK